MPKLKGGHCNSVVRLPSGFIPTKLRLHRMVFYSFNNFKTITLAIPVVRIGIGPTTDGGHACPSKS